MPTIQWNPNTANAFLNGTATGQLFFPTSPNTTSTTQILGSPYDARDPGSILFVFSGTMPGDFSSVSNIASQSSNLLLAMPISSTQSLGVTANAVRYLTGITGIPYVQSISNITVTAGNLVVTQTGHNFIPGQTVTISGVTTGSAVNVNANWTIGSTPNANAWIATASSGSNGTATGTATNGNTTFSYTAQGSGTASWFILARWNNSGANSPGTTISTSLATFGALMGNIGVTGSGSDLEIPNTTITSGSTYSSAGFYLNWPLTWDV